VTCIRSDITVNKLDMMLLGILGLTTVCGLWKGMIRQIVILAGVICGYIISSKFYAPAARILPKNVEAGTAKIISFILIFIVCIIAASVLGTLVDRILKTTGLGWANRFAGGVLGAVKGCIIVAVIVIALMAFVPVDNGLMRTSVTLPYITSGIGLTVRIMPYDIRTDIQKRLDEVKKRLGQNIVESQKGNTIDRGRMSAGPK
jgi:membrane protein required for colicin V production